MKTFTFGCVAAMTLGIAVASAQSTGDKPTAGETGKSAPSFVEKQDVGLLRAPKLVGVSVYDNANKNVGKIDDLLLDHDGTVKAVVIGIGGFLGIGRKDVGVPYSAIHWQTEQRTVAVNEPPPGNAVGNSGNTLGSPNAQPKGVAVDPAETEAYQGYPDRAVLNVSQAELKAAPEFKYATDPAVKASRSAAGDAPAPKKP